MMKKLTKSKFDEQLKSHKIPKKNLNLLHKRCLYNPKNYNRTKIFQEQNALNVNNKDLLNNIKAKRKEKLILKEPTVYNIELNTHAHVSNIPNANYNKDLNNVSASMDYTTLSCCNSELVHGNLCNNSSTCKNMLECEKKHTHHIIEKPVKSRQRHVTNLRKTQKNKFSKNQRSTVQTKLKEMVLEYCQEKKNNTPTSYNYLLRSNSTQKRQKFEMDDLVTNNVQFNVQPSDILKSRRTESKTLTIPRKKEKQHLVQCSELICHRNDCEEETKEIAPNCNEKNSMYNVTSEKRCFENSIQNGVKTRLMMRRESKTAQKNVNHISSVIDISEIETTRSMHMRKRTLQKPQENISAFSTKNEKKEEKLNEDNVSHVIEVKEETIFQRNLEMTTHFHNKCNTSSCNLHSDTFSSNKVPKDNEKHSQLNIQQQQNKLHYFAKEKEQKLSSKHQKKENITQTILQTNFQHLVDSKLQNNCNISMNVKKKNQYGINKSIRIGKSKTNVHSKIKRKEIIKSECHIQIKKGRQKQYGSLKKCERNAIETLKRTCVTKTLEERNSIDTFKITTQTNKNNIKVNKNSLIGGKLMIPLVKLEKLPLYKLPQLQHTQSYTRNEINNLREKETQYSIKNISKAKYSVHKEYKVTKIRKNNKLNQIYRSTKECKDQNIGYLYESKGKTEYVGQKVDTEFEIATFVSTNQLSTKILRKKEQRRSSSRNNISTLSNVKEHFITETACQQLNESQLALNMSLKEASESLSQILNESSNYANENMYKEIDTDIKTPEFKTNKYEISKNHKNNEVETLQNDNSKIHTNQLLQNIYKFFLKNKEEKNNKKTAKKSEMTYLENQKNKIRKRIAICLKCKQVLNLLQEFSGKTNFIKDEKLQIECTLCNVHMNSLSHFQDHLMNVHLQCEGKLLTSNNQFVVDVIDFNVTTFKKNKSVGKFIFECCCCLKAYKNPYHFKQHVKKMHSDFNHFTDKTETCEKKKVTEILELNKINKTLIPDMVSNTTEISNEIKNIHIKKYCSNNNTVNLPDSSNLIVNAQEKQKEMNETNISMNNMTIVAKSTLAESTNDQNSRKYEPEMFCKPLSYYCNICTKSYKKKSAFFSHVSKHATNSNNDMKNVKEVEEILHDNNKNKVVDNKQTNSNNDMENVKEVEEILHDNNKNKVKDNKQTNSNNDMKNVKEVEEVLHNNNKNKVKDNKHLSKTCTNDSDDYSNNYNSNITPNSNVMKSNLEEIKCNITTQNLNTEQINNSNNNNIECIKEKVLEKKTEFDYNYLLHVNCTEKSKKGIEKRKYIKCNVNISKKLRAENAKQQAVNDEIEAKLLISCTKEPNFMFNKDIREVKSYAQKEIRCNICNNKFNSQRMLKEHMFFLHDSILEDQEVSNFLLPHLNDHNIENNVSTQDDNNFENKQNISKGNTLKIFMEEKNNIYDSIICKMFRKCSISEQNKKWYCGLCNENFALIRNYLRHKYYIHNDTSVVHVCDNCNKVLTSVAMVNIHVCTNVTTWNCKRCNLSFNNGISLTQHNINCHFEIAGPHICNVCKLGFLTVYMLEKHQFVHSLINDDSNISNSIDTSVCMQNSLPHNLNNWEYDTENNHMMSYKFTTCMNQNIKHLNNLTIASNTSLNKHTNSDISLESNIEEMFKCKLCSIICLTKIQMKFHLEKCHNLNAEICKLCDRLYIANELTNHLVNFHIVLSDFNLRESSIDSQLKYNSLEDFQHNLVKLIGLKRLITLYEYQRFDIVKQKKYFNCILCLTKFLNVQSYRIHYLRFHDTICFLCNIEFKHHYQAFEHKIKFHVSIDSYLWVIQKITATILQSNEHGSTLEDIILQCSETRIYDDEKCMLDLFSLNNKQQQN